jgi:hypothetical protein
MTALRISVRCFFVTACAFSEPLIEFATDLSGFHPTRMQSTDRNSRYLIAKSADFLIARSQ